MHTYPTNNQEEMTEDEINIALAKALEWSEIRRFPGGLFGLPPDTWKRQGTYWTSLGKYDALNFTSDLDAMHEAEKTRTHEELMAMSKLTMKLGQCCPYHASARQRAEAFLRTIGKWKE